MSSASQWEKHLSVLVNKFIFIELASNQIPGSFHQSMKSQEIIFWKTCTIVFKEGSKLFYFLLFSELLHYTLCTIFILCKIHTFIQNKLIIFIPLVYQSNFSKKFRSSSFIVLINNLLSEIYIAYMLMNVWLSTGTWEVYWRPHLKGQWSLQ